MGLTSYFHDWPGRLIAESGHANDSCTSLNLPKRQFTQLGFAAFQPLQIERLDLGAKQTPQ